MLSKPHLYKITDYRLNLPCAFRYQYKRNVFHYLVVMHHFEIIYILLPLDIKHAWKILRKFAMHLLGVQHSENSKKDKNTVTEIQPAT